MSASPDPATELVELGDAEAVGVEDDHHGGVGDVDPDLDHGGGHQHVEVTSPEGVHRRVLLVGWHPPVQQPDAQALQLLVPEPGVDQLGGGDLHLLRLVDQGTHHIGLAPFGDLEPHLGPHLGQRRLGLLGVDLDAGVLVEFEDGVEFERTWRPNPAGLDRGPTGREFVEHADVEVAIDGHRRGARDRRSGHHQDVGHEVALGLLAERRPLLDAEPVLLVDDDDAEVVEADGILDQGVGADQDVDLSEQQLRQDSFAVAGADPVGEQLDLERPLAEQ